MLKLDFEKKLVLLFFLSGISGLIYEVVWLRMLSRVLGVTNFATTVTLAAYMLGLGIGSYIWGKIADRDKNPLKTFALLQISIVITVFLVPVFLNMAITFYKFIFIKSNGSFAFVAFARILIAFFILLIPTILMGGTLPVIVNYATRKNKEYGNNLSILYGVNTLGAVFGVVLSGYFTIGFFGENESVLLGIVINLFVVYGILQLDKKESKLEHENITQEDKTRYTFGDLFTDKIRYLILVSIFISGFTALSYEIIWNRLLILYLEVSIYAFSGMLAVYLTGISLGSLFLSRIIKYIKKPLMFFGVLEIILGFLSILKLYLFPGFAHNTEGKILATFTLVLPTTFVFGMIFPLAAICYNKKIENSGTTTGMIYIFNISGNVLGSLITGFFLIGFLGSTKTVIILALINTILGYILLSLEKEKLKVNNTVALTAITLIVLFAVIIVKQDVFFRTFFEKNRFIPHYFKLFLHKETIQGVVTSFEYAGAKHLNINGIGQTKLCTETKLMAHIPYFMADNPKKFLIICFGMGTILKSAAIYKELSIDVVELVPELYNCFEFYHPEAKNLLNEKRIRLYGEDGRNFLLITNEKYDIISIDPSPPIDSAGTVNLYTKEFFKLCKEHLTESGVMCLWFPGGKTDEDNWMIINTFSSVFQYVNIWKGPDNWGFYLTGKNKEEKINIKKLEDMYKNSDFVNDITEYGSQCSTADKFLGLLFTNIDQELKKARRYPVITDNNPYTEFQLFRNVRIKKE